MTRHLYIFCSFLFFLLNLEFEDTIILGANYAQVCLSWK